MPLRQLVALEIGVLVASHIEHTLTVSETRIFSRPWSVNISTHAQTPPSVF
jgi:hypothetical protein